MHIDLNNKLHKKILLEFLSALEEVFQEVMVKLHDDNYSKEDIALNEEIAEELLRESAQLIMTLQDSLGQTVVTSKLLTDTISKLKGENKTAPEILNRLGIILKE